MSLPVCWVSGRDRACHPHAGARERGGQPSGQGACYARRSPPALRQVPRIQRTGSYLRLRARPLPAVRPRWPGPGEPWIGGEVSSLVAAEVGHSSVPRAEGRISPVGLVRLPYKSGLREIANNKHTLLPGRPFVVAGGWGCRESFSDRLPSGTFRGRYPRPGLTSCVPKPSCSLTRLPTACVA